MIDAYKAIGKAANMIAVEEVPMDQVSSYGVVGVGKRDGKSFELTGMVEKPKVADAPSNLIITGRYILQPEIFDLLETQQKGAGGEIQLTDALLRLLKTKPGYGFQFDGKTYDCGSKLGFLAANVAYALDREDLAAPLRKELKELLG
jgi:UTP--glucose-1-phosphate uridylyltransferase